MKNKLLHCYIVTLLKNKIDLFCGQQFNNLAIEQSNKGFSLIELLISVAIFIMLMGIITLNLNTAQHKTTIESTLEILITDLNQQQIKAMVGDTEGRTTLDNYGIHFDTTSYTLFHGTYSNGEATNFSIDLPSIQQITTDFANNEVVFQKGSGEISNYDSAADTITLSDITSGEQKVVEMNKLGVVTNVN